MIRYRGTYTLFLKEVTRFKEVWAQTVIAPVVNNLLFLIIFGAAFSGRASNIEGVGYMSILIPGLAAMGIMMNAMQNPMSSLMISKYTNVIRDLLTIPLNGAEILLSYVLSGLFRGLLVGTITIIVGMFFSDLTFQHPGIILLFATLMGGTFASFGTIIGIALPDFDKSAMITNFVVTPLIYLGGVFYTVSSLPEVVQIVSKFNPIFYLVDGFRYGFIGAGDAPILLSTFVATTIFAICFGIAAWMLHTGYKLKT